ncbi:hypothetical protein SAMN05444159_1242 [Bradyrhizobium lablabi]|uniref:Uncharacterized protein n=1 Tax=Bradyrhizobium lablabi TaxID=722472 RepID=A0A1M6LDA2_9BRAD|nr:hypothetical protein [Bradyrhizobium lablabi]SHJ69065.1 hypothetical protein SAMN05444159_1242 [Bradyrhizobium lablabi]
MIGNALAIIKDAAVFSGEFKRDLIATGVVMLIVLVVWAIQTFWEGRAK